jgi:hypothetical protein
MKKSLTLSLASLLAALGCSSGPSAVRPPSIDADDAASEAMEMYDKDGDGAIAGSELDAVPAFKSAMKNLDKNGDGNVQEHEIAARIQSWQASGVGVLALTWSVSMDGRPVVGAKITFEPEPFLGEEVRAGQGETSSMGTSIVSVPKAERPASDTPPGLQPGFYKVRISKEAGGKETIPARYNSETTLGQEIASDDPAIAGQKTRFELSTK